MQSIAYVHQTECANPSIATVKKEPVNKRRIAFLLITGLIATALGAPPTLADLVVEFGANGANGADGAPGTIGGDGRVADPATAVAEDSTEQATAVAIGGRGGAGGRGGNAIVGSGAMGSRGGSGADGGDAIAQATTTDARAVRAAATGGNGGASGFGGVADGSPELGPDGIASGSGGDATAIASVTETETAMRGRIPNSQSIAIGGSAGRGESGEAGNASARIEGSFGIRGDPIDVRRVNATARGGFGGFRGGSADAVAIGDVVDGTLLVEADAIAGAESMSFRAPGADANSSASGTLTGRGRLDVAATSSSGARLAGADSGTLRAEASGIAIGDALVRVSAAVVGGNDLELRDAVSGSTAGRLELTQSTLSSFARQSFTPAQHALEFGGSGTTRTSLVAENAGGGDVGLRLFAIGSQTESGGEREGDVIIGDVSGFSTNAADVDVAVFAEGRRIFQEKLDDSTSASQITGSSNRGDVSVRADFILRGPEVVRQDGDLFVAPDGTSILMSNAVQGETSGNLELEQNARAADGVSIVIPFAPGEMSLDGLLIGGSGGNATNRLTKSTSSESLSLRATSRAGRAGTGGGALGSGAGTTIPGNGGSATTVVEGSNDSGSVRITGNAISGAGITNAVRPSNGGDAIASFTATTFESGQSIQIGSELGFEIDATTGRPILRIGARGGIGGGTTRSATSERTGSGGDAHSQSNGIARGESEVAVYDLAIGGQVGLPNRFAPPVSKVEIGRGGDATSRATAENTGLSTVIAGARAFGGAIQGNSLGYGGRGGDARSFAQASGLGSIEATALAVAGGDSTRDFRSGSAYASAETLGTAATTRAESQAGGDALRAMISRQDSGPARLESTVAYSTPTQAPGVDYDGSVFLIGSPNNTSVVERVARNSALGELIAQNPRARVEALGGWNARGGDAALTTQLVELDITLATPDDGGNLALAISSIGPIGSAFESLRFRLEVLGETFGSEIEFNAIEDAEVYFSNVIRLGQAYREFVAELDLPALRAVFEVSLLTGQEVAFELAAVVIPEPSTALLLGIGIMILAINTRHRPSTVARAC